MAVTVADLAMLSPKVLSARATVADVRRMLSSEHVHIALIVDAGFLVTTIERSDINVGSPGDEPAREFGTLFGRVVDADTEMDDAWNLLNRERRRRLAVVDETGRLIGLLCLKRSRRGFCSDVGIASRADERAGTRGTAISQAEGDTLEGGERGRAGSQPSQ